MKIKALTLLLLFFSSISIGQSKNQNLIHKINTKLDDIWKDSNAPGFSFSVAFPNGEVKSFTRGFADIENNIKMSSKTKMLGGSTGKVFYSVVALQLIDEGKLDLDTPIFSKMTDFKWFSKIPNAKSLTVRSLMRHETGIPRYVFKPKFQKDVLQNVNKAWKPEELLSYVFEDKPDFAVGEKFAYSDTNYIVLCLLIEKITGNSIYKEVKNRVLKKAGLKNVVPQTKRSYKNIAQGYNAEKDPFFPGLQFNKDGKSKYNLQFEWAGGGLVITSHDLAKLGKKIYEGEMFNPSLLKEYFKGIDAGNLGGQWGLGVHIRESPFGKTYGHSGFMPGYITNMIYFKKDKFAICYQVNTSDRTRLSFMRGVSGLGKLISEELNK